MVTVVRITACSTFHIMLFIMLIVGCFLIVIVGLLFCCVIFVILTPLVVFALLFVAVVAAAGWTGGFLVEKLMILLELFVLVWFGVLHLMFLGCGF
jgi:hypothetical protein